MAVKHSRHQLNADLEPPRVMVSQYLAVSMSPHNDRALQLLSIFSYAESFSDALTQWASEVFNPSSALHLWKETETFDVIILFLAGIMRSFMVPDAFSFKLSSVSRCRRLPLMKIMFLNDCRDPGLKAHLLHPDFNPPLFSHDVASCSPQRLTASLRECLGAISWSLV